MKSEIFLIRSIHGAITVFFLACIFYIYYAGLTNQRNMLVYLAIIAIIIEGIVVGVNGGMCPLGVLHHKAGDDKTFFELFLLKKAAKLAVPVLGAIATIGIILVFM